MGSASDDSGPTHMTGGTGGATPAPELSILFRDTPIRVAPREERRITVKVSPAGAYPVRFALLSAEADSALDAALDRSEVISDASGLASVMLSAPSSPLDFLLRAQVGAVSTTTTVSVVPGAHVNLVVIPKYESKRITGRFEWVASVHVGTGCEDFADGSVPDGPLFVRAPPGTPLRLADIPAAEKLAVTLRADQFARGCTTLQNPVVDADSEVTVTVSDQPIDLSITDLEVSLGIEAKDAAFTAELDDGLASMQAAMFGGAANQLVVLLDDMQAELKAGNANKFALARVDAGWDDTVLSLAGSGDDTLLGKAVTRFARLGRASLFSPLAFEARLAAGADPATPSFTLVRVGGVAAEQAGLRGEGRSWNVDSSDVLGFAATLTWRPSALQAALSIAAASAETGEKDVPSALAELLNCTDLGDALSRDSMTSDAVAELTGVCPITCLQTTCEAALVRMWNRAVNGSGSVGTEMSVLATARATVGPERQASQLTMGSWVGRLTNAGQVSQSGGSLEGNEPR